MSVVNGRTVMRRRSLDVLEWVSVMLSLGVLMSILGDGGRDLAFRRRRTSRSSRRVSGRIVCLVVTVLRLLDGLSTMMVCSSCRSLQLILQLDLLSRRVQLRSGLR